MKTQKLYWGKTIASFFLVLFTMPLGHALMRVMEDTMSPTLLMSVPLSWAPWAWLL